MSQIFNVINPLTPAQVATIKADLAAINVVITPAIILRTETQRKSTVIVGTVREAEMADVQSGLAEAYPDLIGADFTLAGLKAMNQEQIDSYALEAICLVMASFFKDHAEIVGNNRMLMIIEVLDNARQAAKSNTGIAEALKKITDKYLVPGPRKGITTIAIVEAGIMGLTGLKKNKPIINDGKTILTVLGKNASAALTITINPGDSAVMPSGWTNVTITNLSATTAGSFQAYFKA